jgi:alpha-galactosidase
MNSFTPALLPFLLSLSLLPLAAQNNPPSLTPASPSTPQIHGAKVFGVRPGRPFLFTVAATGDRPMTFAADNLPAGLTLDGSSGLITGTAPAVGDYPVTLHAKNSLGDTTRPLLIKVGDTIALTPPLGWNSWNCFAGSVTAANVRAAADVMVSSGLINHGWTYVNVDDYWQVKPTSDDPTLHGPERNPDGTIHPNPRFPDMKGLADYIHAKGLKAGLYSSPGPYTCGGCVGSYQHEAQDVQTYAAWGFDYLKYDWCSYGDVYQKVFGGQGREGLIVPYRLMGGLLAKTPRDIIYSLCQYGMADSWNWAASVEGNTWRTTGDISDTWDSMISNGERGLDIGQHAGPGHWNDPDMLVVGVVAGGRPTRLTPDEQYTHISLWCLQAAPLLIGCDLTKLDAFTLGLLTNDEVIDVDQDALGKAARLVSATFTLPAGNNPNATGPDLRNANGQVWARPLEDGSIAVGLFNLGSQATSLSVSWADLHLSGSCKVRDLWRQKDLGAFTDGFQGTVPTHGVLLLRISKS